jgi:dihydroxyacetone kinase
MSHPSTLLKQLGSIAETAMGGTSGALYSLMLTMAGTALEAEAAAMTARTWATALMAGTNGTMHYSQAKLGDRSMVRMRLFLWTTKFLDSCKTKQ